MFVTRLELVDFRSWQVLDLQLDPGVTVFTGANGQGKTNLVEAIDFLATLGSHRVATEAPLIRFGAARAMVRARVQAGLLDDRQLLLEIELIRGQANRASLNRVPLKRTRDLLGGLRTVFFSPEDLALVKGDPAIRRRFLDELCTARWPRMAGVRADYEKVLRQRSMLLKSLGGQATRRDESFELTLEIFDERLQHHGAEIVEARLRTITDLRPGVVQAYADIAPSNNQARLEYVAAAGHREDDSLDVIKTALGASIKAVRSEEMARGLTLAGPHRDDIAFSLGELPARGYASHGESWSFALALRLGSLQLLRADGFEPVLILDDVFAELDSVRRERLARWLSNAEQVLITAAVAEDVPAVLGGRRFTVQEGTVVVNDGAVMEAEVPR